MSVKEAIKRSRRLRILHLQIAALACIFVVFLLSVVGVVYNVISLRACAFIWIASFCSSIFLSSVIQKRIKDARAAAGPRQEIPIDERTRTHVLRRIRHNRFWVGFLLIALLLGVAVGIHDHAGLPLLAGVAINQALMWMSIYEIRRLRKFLDRGTMAPPL